MNQTLRFLQQENARLQAENKQLQDDLDLLRDYLSALNKLDDAADQLVSEEELVPLLDKILYYALTISDSSDGSVVLLDDETDELVFSIVRGRIESKLTNFRMPKTQGVAGWVVTRGRPVIVNDVEQDMRFSPQVDRLFGYETRSILCVPLKIGQRILGAISLFNKSSGANFSEIDQSLLSILARVAAFALVRFEEETD